MERLKLSFRNCYGRYGDLIKKYEVSLSRMLNDILTLDQQWLPNRSDCPPISWPWYMYRAWPSPRYEWFPWSICNGHGMPAGNAYPSGHPVPSPFLGLACVPIVETRTSHVFTRLFTLNTPWCFLDFALNTIPSKMPSLHLHYQPNFLTLWFCFFCSWIFCRYWGFWYTTELDLFRFPFLRIIKQMYDR